jgi:hypothetical protein
MGLQPVARGHICKLCIHDKITQLRQLGTPLTLFCPRAARELANDKVCGLLPYKGSRLMS